MSTSSLMQRTTHRLCITVPDVVLGQLITLSNEQGRSVSNLAAFLLEGADIGLDHMVAQGNPVARIGRGRSGGPLFGMREGEANVTGHLCPLVPQGIKSMGQDNALPRRPMP